MPALTKLTRPRIVSIAAGALLAAASVAACGGGSSEIAGDRIFESVPWTGEERFVYRLSDRQIDGEPTCEHFTRPEVRPGETVLEERCTLREFSDRSLVVAGSEDLHPVSSERTIVDDGSVTHTVEYSDTAATFRTFLTGDDEESREATRDLPEPTEEHPDPAWYDDKSLFWLARGLPLVEDYEATYVHVINVGAPRVLPVEVSVDGREAVETPLGTFDAWKVRFERDNTVYFLWVATEGSRPVVKARIESVTYDLVEASPPLD